ncbi:hypothetical protein COT42_09080 [Candidatus Saganbacteria bacterium CG08_land_8_20_14_0_20_45_16]|uniref:Glycosyltransferase RgtA/B/C/D-like domain-containing protein n=1 Tax=Candidatus Saganbacteria bacterium CG08_land_8_20_14_0_20_45_16 TaxID=2014293 RepID=A0A2H0XTP2_UNCSA|nr:MAG: hypothetical protein COT42_09080 [Candidatus Saganbacteria bacterium CG08_land_8_20_14_0_20_45_16]
MRWLKIIMTDRLAIGIIIGLIIFGGLTPVFRAMVDVPYVGAYFYEMKTVLPRLNQQFFMISEVDCIGYYSYLRSLMIDHDLEFQNDFTLFGWPRRAQEKTDLGHTTNPWSVGPAILWAPAFVLAHLYSLLLNAVGHPVPLNGVSFVYDFFIVVFSMGSGLLGLIFIYKFLRFFFSAALSLTTVLAFFYASTLVFYQFHEPTMSHVLSVFAVSGFIYFWYDKFLQKRSGDWLWLGVWAGLIILIRSQNIFFVLGPLLAETIVMFKREQSVGFRWLLGPAQLLIMAFLCFIPQMLAWKFLYGSCFTIPQGEGFMKWGAPQIPSLLFSTNHGLITYTPIMLFCLIGFLLVNRVSKREQMLAGTFFLIFCCELYINAAASDWGAGWAFGARRFSAGAIMFAWGLGMFLRWSNYRQWLRYLVLSGVALLVIFNLLFYFQWAYGLIPRGEALTLTQYFSGKWQALTLWLTVLRQIFEVIFS